MKIKCEQVADLLQGFSQYKTLLLYTIQKCSYSKKRKTRKNDLKTGTSRCRKILKYVKQTINNVYFTGPRRMKNYGGCFENERGNGNGRHHKMMKINYRLDDVSTLNIVRDSRSMRFSPYVPVS